MAKNYSPAIANAISTFLTEDNWKYEFDRENGTFVIIVSLESGLKSARLLINVRENNYTVYAYSQLGPDKDDKKAMLRTAEFLTRANYGLVRGSFDLDMNDGEVLFKVCTACDGGRIAERTIRFSIYIPAMMLDKYGNGLLKVLYSDITPKEACEQCEKDN